MTMVALGEAMRTPVERPVSHRWCQQVLLSSACAFLASEMRGLLRIALGGDDERDDERDDRRPGLAGLGGMAASGVTRQASL